MMDEMYDRIKKSSLLALQYGMIDGSHHKQWVIDQMLRHLLLTQYQDTINTYNKNEDYENWDVGIEP